MSKKQRKLEEDENLGIHPKKRIQTAEGWKREQLSEKKRGGRPISRKKVA